VDDNQDAAETMAEFMSLCGHIPRVALNGVTALAESELFLPDVVLLDIDLPDMSGTEVAARMKLRSGRTPPILVAVTGYERPSDRSRALEAGFDHYFTKPVDIDRVERLLADI
jgi:CheY-like chemotaxis protein